ncbi:MAG: type II secretion system protein [Phycisphaerales bacterium]
MHSTPAHTPLTVSLRRGFTLVELLVVISIIAVLIGVVIAVGSALGAKSDITRTQNSMNVLNTALSEWEAQAGRSLTWGINGVPGPARYDLQADTPHIFTVTEFLAVVGQPTEIRTMLASLDERRAPQYNSSSPPAPAWLRNPSANEPDPLVAQWIAFWSSGVSDGFPTVLDAWDHPIRFIHAGRLWSTDSWFDDQNNGIVRDADGTVRTPLEELYGVAQNRRPFFVSAGPSGEFGNLSLVETDPVHQFAHDNIYFPYDPEHPE